MSPTDAALKQLIRETIAEILTETPQSEPELVTIADVTGIIGCDESVVHALIAKKDATGFPAIRLGQRTIRIDKQRLIAWLNKGGLDSNGSSERSKVVSIGDLRAA